MKYIPIEIEKEPPPMALSHKLGFQTWWLVMLLIITAICQLAYL